MPDTMWGPSRLADSTVGGVGPTDYGNMSLVCQGGFLEYKYRLWTGQTADTWTMFVDGGNS